MRMQVEVLRYYLPGQMTTRLRRIAFVVTRVPVAQAEIQTAHGALHWNELFLLARLVRALVGEYFRLVRLAVLVNVLADRHVR